MPPLRRKWVDRKLQVRFLRRFRSRLRKEALPVGDGDVSGTLQDDWIIFPVLSSRAWDLYHFLSNFVKEHLPALFPLRLHPLFSD